MDDLQLIIHYKGEELELPVEAYPYGYTYRLGVKYGKQVITFEPDEEGSFRAFADPNVEKGLIAIIATELEKLK